jgi:hypothetical protein
MHDDSSEFLGPKHGHEQVDEQQQGDNTRDDSFHRFLLEFFAKPGVKAADDKKAGDDANKNQIIHRILQQILTTFFLPAFWIQTNTCHGSGIRDRPLPYA